MYFIKKIVVDDKLNYLSSNIVAHTNKTIAYALNLLETSVKNYVRDEHGRIASEQMEIICIHDLNQVHEPLVDGVLLYRLDTDPHKILVYQRKSETVTSTTWTWSTTTVLVPKFRLTDIFELEEYTELKIDTNSPTEYRNRDTNKTCESNIKNLPPPPPLNTPPPLNRCSSGVNLLDDLKKSDKFKEYFLKANEAKPITAACFLEQ